MIDSFHNTYMMVGVVFLPLGVGFQAGNFFGCGDASGGQSLGV